MKMPSKQLIITSAVCLILGLALVVFFNLEHKKEKKQAKESNVKTTAVATANEEGGIRILPTMQIPKDLKNPLTPYILGVLNVYLSQTVDSSIGELRLQFGPELNRLKREIYLVIEKELNESAVEDLDVLTANIRNKIDAAMSEAKEVYSAQAVEDKPEFYKPIDPDNIHIKEVAGHQNLIIASTVASVDCGGDVSLYLLRKTGNAHKLILEIVNNDPEAYGYENFHYAVSTPENPDDFFLVAAYGHPWCTSCWGGLIFQVLKPGADPQHPKVILNESEFIYKCGEVELNAGKSDFMLTYTDRQGLDMGIFARKHIRHYTVENDKAMLIAPLGDFPEDFLDEWIQLPWADAVRFCTANIDENVRSWHEKLNKVEGGSGSIKFVQPCAGPEERWEVGVETGDSKLPETLYFEILRINGDFILRKISEKRTGDCPGEATPEPHDVDMG